MLQFAIPIIVTVIISIFWLCRQVLVTNVIKQDRLLRSTGLLKFHPNKFRGARKERRYFEGRMVLQVRQPAQRSCHCIR